jgi:uncharacterized membrane protein YhhN
VGVELALAGLGFVVCGALAVWGKQAGRPLLHTCCKLATVGVVLAVVLRHGAPDDLASGVALALCFSLVGDYVLTRDERFFVWGLAAFHVALVVYAFTFASQGGHLVTGLGVLLPAVALVALVLRPIWARFGSLRIPVVIYATTLCAARVAAPTVGASSAALAVLGAIAFMSGDAMLAYRRFGGPRAPYAIELGAYFVAQALLAGTTLTR